MECRPRNNGAAIIKLGTINICGVNNELEELVDVIHKRKIQIMGLADTRLKDRGCKEIHRNYTLIYSGVDSQLKAKHGVGIIIEPSLAKRILEINYISERIITVKIKEQEITTYIQVYAPCNASNNEEECEEFYDELHNILTKFEKHDNIIVLGDFNAKPGCDRSNVERHLGAFGDQQVSRNENGSRLLELCC